MFSNDFMSRLEREHGGLRPAEKSVARVVLDDPQFTLRASNAEIARKAEVSEPTVTRFCRSMGCEGVRDFKIQLAGSMARGTPYIHRAVNAWDEVGEIGRKILDSAGDALTRTGRQLDAEVMERVVKTLAGCERVFFFGVGCGSGIVAQDAWLRFSRLGMEARACTDGHLQQVAALAAEEQTVIMAISHTGRTKEVLDSAALAASRGATVIALTRPHTPLAALCHLGLFLEIPEDTDIYIPGASRMAHLAVMDILSVATSRERGEEALDHLRRVKEHLAGQRVSDNYQPPYLLEERT